VVGAEETQFAVGHLDVRVNEGDLLGEDRD
jgi:hypothetical protein